MNKHKLILRKEYNQINLFKLLTIINKTPKILQAILNLTIKKSSKKVQMLKNKN